MNFRSSTEWRSRPLTDEDLQLLREWRGLQADAGGDALRSHVLRTVSALMRRSHTYKCIAALAFLHARCTEIPEYAALRAAGAKPGATILDVGCGLGQESRRLLLGAHAARRTVPPRLRRACAC